MLFYHRSNGGSNLKIVQLNSVKTVHLYQIEIHAYCLMDNHYHLLVHTPHANLGRAMRHINGVYTQRFNRLEKRDGALYRSRYKAILIEEEVYLLQVSRYIHLNPVSASICSTPDNYPWSSYNNYVNKNNKQTWLITKKITDEFGCIEEYIDYVSCGINQEITNFYCKNQTPPILATTHFKNKITRTFTMQKSEEIASDVKHIHHRPSIGIIIGVVANFFKINDSDLIKSQRGKENIPRLIAIYLSRQMDLYTYTQIGTSFNSRMYAINSSLKRFRKILDQNLELNANLNRIKQKIYENV